MSLVIMGASYKSAPIESRERVAVQPGALDGCLDELRGADGVNEVVILSTCNRVEAYVDAKPDRLGVDALRAFFRRRAGDAFSEGEFYVHRGMDTVEHAYRVVCSLDSQLLGEAQILGQMRGAFEAAVAHGSCGEVLTRLFKSSLHLGKRVRAQTAIGSDTVSLSTTAFKVARDRFPDLARRRALIVGTGEMARLAATYLADGSVGAIEVTSRTPEHAAAFAREFGAAAVPFAERYDALARADVAFTMTSSDDPVVEAAPLRAARERAGATARDLVIIDEAVPRDVAPACDELPGVTLYNLEALSSIIDEGMAQRMAAVGDVERMVAEEMREFFAWMQQRLVLPTVKGMREKADAVVASQAQRAVKALAHLKGAPLTDEERDVLLAFGASVAKSILHGPTVRLRKEAGTADSYYYTGAARYLFGLDAFPPGSGAHHAVGTCPGTERCLAGGCDAGARVSAGSAAPMPCALAQMRA